MRNRLALIGAVAALLALGVVLWLLRPGDPPAPEPAPTPTAEVVAAAAPEAAPRPEPAPPEEETPFEPRTAPEEALAAVAEAVGAGVVRCPLPADAPDELQVPFAHYVYEGDDVVAMVTEAEGLGPVRPGRPDPELASTDPDGFFAQVEESQRELGVWVWGGAWPGLEGWCTLEPSRTVRIRGQVVRHPEADPARPLVVNGCGGLGSSQVAPDGSFEREVAYGPRCKLEVNTAGFEGTWIQPDRDQDDIVVHEAAPEDSHGKMARKMEQLLAEVEQLEAMADPLERALQGELSDEARALVTDWRDADREDVEQKRAFYEQSAELFGAFEGG